MISQLSQVPVVVAGVLAVVLLTTGACSTTPKQQTLLPETPLSSDSRYALLWIKPCIPKLIGGCEPDDGRTTEAKLAIHGVAEQIDLKQQYEDDIALSASIARTDAGPTIEQHYLQSTWQTLAARGLNVVAVANPVYAGALNKSKRSKRFQVDDTPVLGATQFPVQVLEHSYDFMPVYDKLNVDHLVVLELLRFNIERHYSITGKPASNPHIVAAVRVYVHKRAGDTVVFNDYAHNISISSDEWDAPPHYQELSDRLLSNLTSSIKDSVEKLVSLEFR